MDLQERIKKVSPYFKSFEYVNNFILVKVVYKKGWNVIPPETDNIKISSDDNDSNLYYYYADINEDCNLIFNSIEKTISFNIESENKVELLKEKIEELRKVFLENDIETLKTIKFSMQKKRGRTKVNNKLNDANIKENE